jgi:chromosomal replication initiation ATPase DnaA
MSSPEFTRLRQRHSELVLDLMRAGFLMRTIRRYRLDDPRITDEVRTMLVQDAKERQSLATIIRLSLAVAKAPATQPNNEPTQERSPAAPVVLDPPALKAAIQAIRQQVSEHFYMGEMRDPELTVRSNRRPYVLPRQLAMYIAKQLTGATLQEIGREFGGRHHTTVLHAINRIEAMRRTDQALNRTIARLVNTVVAQT